MPDTYTSLLYHIVFSTKNRYRFINADIEQRLFPYMGGIIRHQKGKLLEINGIADHVHLLASFHPKTAVSEMLRVIKSESSRWLNESVMRFRKFGWQDGYGAFTVSESATERVRRYIRNQKEHHQVMGFREEFSYLLRKHRIECDDSWAQ